MNLRGTLLQASSSPHIRDAQTTPVIMLDVLIALIPATAAGIIFFGYYSALVLVVSVTGAILSEEVYRIATKQPSTMLDLSAAVTGLILGLMLPPSVPIYIPLIGSAFAVIIAKQIYGGLGHNFMNPAAVARCFLLISFSRFMTAYIPTRFAVDAVSSATPMALLKAGQVGLPALWQAFIGNTAGSIGETSELALLIGGVYLLFRRVISWRIPVIFIASVALMTLMFDSYRMILPQLLNGGLFFGAIYMATDTVTSPVTKWGQVAFALGCGVMTSVFRLYGGMNEGVAYAILIMNILTPLIERFTRPRIFGEGKRHG